MESNCSELLVKYRNRRHLGVFFERLAKFQTHSLDEELGLHQLYSHFKPKDQGNDQNSYRIKPLDDLLDFYSLMEIALFSGFVDNGWENSAQEGYNILSIGAINAYTLTTYPSTLPIQFAERTTYNDFYGLENHSELFLKFLLIYDFVCLSESLQRLLNAQSDELNLFMGRFQDLNDVSEEKIHEVVENTLYEGLENYIRFIELLHELLVNIDEESVFASSIFQFFNRFIDPNNNLVSRIAVLIGFFTGFISGDETTMEEDFKAYELERITNFRLKWEFIQEGVSRAIGMLV